MSKIKVGVVGVGVLGRHHARLYQHIPAAELVGIYDIDLDHARRIAQEFSITAFDVLENLADRVDCMSVAVPTDLHFSVVSILLAAGKHVLVEKPISATLDEGRQLTALAHERRRILQVGHVERYNPIISYLEKKIDRPRFIEAHRLAPYPPPRPGLHPRGTEVGVVLDLMIHDIDIILSLVKSPITSIHSVGIPILSPTEDIANARINFANGCVANLTASRVSQEYLRKIRVFQSQAYLSLDYQEKTGEIISLKGKTLEREPLMIEDGNALRHELEDFIRCVGEALHLGTLPQPKVSAEHALQALEVADTIIRQIHENA
jgi:predicted dehydrogenase